MNCDVLITGGGGFIGSHLVGHLLGQGCGVRVMDLPEADLTHLPTDRLDIVRGDIREPADVRRAVDGAAIVLHLAANPNLWARDSRLFEQVNHQGTRHVLDAAVRAGARRIVHVSTESVLSQPDPHAIITERTPVRVAQAVGPYCRSKALAEQAAWQAAEGGAPVTIVNPTVPVGPGDHHRGPLSRLIIDYAARRIRATLDSDLALVDVRDVATGIWAAARRGQPNRRYLLAGENWTTVRLFDALEQLTGRPAPRWAVPYPLALTFAHLEQWCCRTFNGRVPMATVAGVRLTRRSMRFDNHRTCGELGLQPRPVNRALAEAVQWFAQRGWLEAAGPAQPAPPARPTPPSAPSSSSSPSSPSAP